MNDSGSNFFLSVSPHHTLESVKTLMSGLDNCENCIHYLLNTKTGTYTFISHSVKAVCGYPVDIFEEKGLAFFLSILHPRDYPRVLQEYMTVDKDGDRPGQALSSFEFRVRHPSSGWLWLEDNCFAIEIEEGIRRVFGMIKVISERKKKESFLWQEIRKREKCPENLEKLAKQYARLSREELSDPVQPDEILLHDRRHCTNGLVSDREMEVLKLIADGFSSKQLASVLNISTHTAISHRKHLLEKFKVKNTAELIKVAFKSFWPA